MQNALQQLKSPVDLSIDFMEYRSERAEPKKVFILVLMPMSQSSTDRSRETGGNGITKCFIFNSWLIGLWVTFWFVPLPATQNITLSYCSAAPTQHSFQQRS